MPPKIGKKVGIHFYENVLSEIDLPLQKCACCRCQAYRVRNTVLYLPFTFSSAVSQCRGIEFLAECAKMHKPHTLTPDGYLFQKSISG